MPLLVIKVGSGVLVVAEEVGHVAFESIPKPELVLLYQGKKSLVLDRVLVANDQELLVVLEQLRDILAEQREGWVGYHDVCLLQQFDGLRAAEVAVTLQRDDPDLRGVGDVVVVPVPVVLKVYGLFGVVLAEEVDFLTLVARGDELLQSQLLEVVGEVVEEVA